MGTYKIEQISQGHPSKADGQPNQEYQTWCYRITFTPAGAEGQAFPRAIGDYWIDYKKGKFAPVDGAPPAGVDPTTWPGSTIEDPHPKQADSTVFLQPTNNPTPVNNADGSVSMTFCFATKTVKKAGEIELSLEYKDASGFHILPGVGRVKLFGPLASAEALKDEEALVTLLASYEGIKSAATAVALLSHAGDEGLLSVGETALIRLRGELEEPEDEVERVSPEEPSA